MGAGAGGSLILFAGTSAILLTWDKAQTVLQEIPAVNGENIQMLGLALVDPMGFLIPFEVASVLLLAALVAAIFLTADIKRSRS